MAKKKFSFHLLFLYAFILITFFAIMIGVWIHRDIKEERVKDLNYTNAVIKRYYELSFNQWGNSLLSLGQRLVEIEGKDKEEQRLHIVNKTIKNYKELMAFGLADTTGQVLTFSGVNTEDSLPNLMLSENSRRSFILARKAKGLSIGESYYFSNVDDWILPLRIPIRDDNGILLAINTTAIQYKSMDKELSSFGFDSSYRIHLINKDFNSTQLYYPFRIDQYSNILQKDANIYDEIEHDTFKGISFFKAINTLEKHNSIAVCTTLPSINHELVVSVDEEIIWAEMIGYVYAILILYLIFIAVLIFAFIYSSKKEQEFVSQLQLREANLKAIFESTNSIIGLFDKRKILIEFNQAFADYAKQANNITLTKNMDVFSQMSEPLGSIFKGFQDRALSGEKFKETLEYPSQDGGSLHFLFSYHPIYQKGEITGLSMFVEDITMLKNSQIELERYSKNLEEIVRERTAELEEKNIALEKGNLELENALIKIKATQKQLVQVEKMASLGVLAAGIGHEINNPLNFIKNGLSALNQELMDEKYEKRDGIEPYITIINDGVSRASKIVKSLSHFSRQQKSMDEKCEVEEIIDHCLVILQNNLKNKVDVIKNIDHREMTVMGNEGKLHQAFLNIISNAEQAISDQGVITISSRVEDGKLIISINDNGQGIDQKNLEKIGDPFFTTKDPGQGTGLGLFITYSIIEEHNGQIDVISEPTIGTTFTITLPIS